MPAAAIKAVAGIESFPSIIIYLQRLTLFV